MRRPSDVVDENLRAYNARDLDAFMRSFDANIEVRDLKSGEVTMRGLDEVRARYADLFANSPTLACRILNRTEMGDLVTDHERVTGRLGVEIEALVTYEIRDERIARMWMARAAALAESQSLPSQARVARPTKQIDALVRFYRDGLGLPVLGGFEGHAGFDGVMIGLPGVSAHLELTSSPGATKLAEPGPEDLLVLYYASTALRDDVVARLKQMGHAPIAPENPYWIGKAEIFVDPDGWHIALYDGLYSASGAIPARFR
jgi:catechol 2,3-dioxygenase-like lactoylglutathione lyase family enzyme